MKIGQIILLHLYKNKQVTLQGIGTLYLDPSVSLPPGADSTMTFPENAVTFDYNPSATEDASLIESIVHYTKKSKALAAADLDSFLHWQKQLLNINMAFNLGDIGMLQKTVQGVFRFIPYQPPSSKINATKSGKTKNAGSAVFYKYNMITGKYSKKKLRSIIIIFGVGLTAWILYVFVITNKSRNENLSEKIPTPFANNKLNLIKKDTLKSIQPINTVFTKNENNSYVFKVVFFKTRIREEALKALDEIYGFGHSATMYSIDSVYKIAMPFNRPLSDTSHIKDSLNLYYSLGKGSVETE